MTIGNFWWPMCEETNAWLSRVSPGEATPHPAAAEAHRNLMLTKAMDLSAAKKSAIPLPITPKDLR